MSKPMQFQTPLGRIMDSEGRKQTWLARELSAALGKNISSHQVNGWCKGRIPQPSTRDAIARVLGRTTSELWPATDHDVLDADAERESEAA